MWIAKANHYKQHMPWSNDIDSWLGSVGFSCHPARKRKVLVTATETRQVNNWHMAIKTRQDFLSTSEAKPSANLYLVWFKNPQGCLSQSALFLKRPDGSAVLYAQSHLKAENSAEDFSLSKFWKIASTWPDKLICKLVADAPRLRPAGQKQRGYRKEARNIKSKKKLAVKGGISFHWMIVDLLNDSLTEEIHKRKYTVSSILFVIRS